MKRERLSSSDEESLKPFQTRKKLNRVRSTLETDREDNKTSISESIEDIEDNPTILHYPSCSDPSTSNPGRHKRKTCRHCKKTTKYFCDGCPPDHRGVIGLCPECFRAYHGH
ncbi:PREDICTED: uncharacterized protein LOC108550959 [Eufriesea mexicana]|uniref:uncharacterized protein LOC108550959 n=1 Tax=Eufriesea mexicana TaxID=516756 RepID=UPI00083C80EC|nr:PREDICTED: uncharacterized protein LOC108550959 [Eufriesea mexicana]